METNGGGSSSRARWTAERRRKEPTLYDEWLNQEKAETQAQSPRLSLPMRHGDTAATGASTLAATIRPIPPDEAVDADADDDMDEESAIVPERGTTSFEQVYIPRTTTTIVGGPAALSAASSPYSALPKSKRLVKGREWERDARLASHSPPSSRNGSHGSGMLARTSSKANGSSSNGHRVHVASMIERDVAGNARPRTRTLEEPRIDRAQTDTQAKSRIRVASLDMPSSGAEYLASVPASISPPSAPSMNFYSSPVQGADDAAGRSTSRASSSAADSMKSNQSSGRKISYLMNTLKGRMSGHVSLRRDWDKPWTDLFCYIKEDSGRLGYEPPGSENSHRTLVRSLKGCTVKPHAEGETLYLEVAVPQSDTKLHFKLLTQPDFDSWFAALLWWQQHEPKAAKAIEQTVPRPPSSTSGGTSGRPELPPRTSSARGQRDRADSSRSDRRKSVVSSKEAPVIKIGKMIYWDTNIGYSNAPPTGSVGQPSTGRPQAYRVQSYGSRRWNRISGQLRENGELKLHSDNDNSLISVVQLSQLSRCAIQRLDPSVLENEFCIAIYPQYTSNSTNTQPGFLRPIFLSLENRVLFEVWFVLLRAFTIPQLYGPPIATKATGEASEIEEAAGNQDLENMLATTTTDMFRMERTMSIRIIEAKIFPTPTSTNNPDPSFSGGHSRGAQMANTKPETHGYYAEVLLDNETRAKTVVKYDGLTPLWSENFEFLDLPPVLSSTTMVIKRRPPNAAHAREKQESRLIHEAYGLTDDQHGGYSGLTFDVVCGKVEIFLHELEEEKEVEKWWPVVNMHNQRVGEVLIKTRIDEGVILMQRDYKPLSELLHRFTNGLTLQIAQMVPSELKRVSDCLLNIFQVSGKVSDWISALVEEEIDGIHKETPISKLRYSRRVGSDVSHEGTGSAHSDRELIVRDLNKNATLEANLLFRGNTLLTKSVDTHMRRIGKEYLEESLGATIREINEKEPDCEVDPSRVPNQQQIDANWKRLLTITQEVWKSIVAAKPRCPIELRVIFRHIRACAEDRYGDFLRSVCYSSVSGFLFLRFFCPAVLNPKLFGLLNEDVKPRARRTFTLIAKSLQTMSNMASFGAKETWMEPMNAFLVQNRNSFKDFIDDICYVPTPLTTSAHPRTSGQSPTYPPGVVSAETHLSYTTPMTIMQRLPPTSREGFPSLPYLIDQARAFAELIQLWLEATTEISAGQETMSSARSHAELMSAIKASEGDLMAFHEICIRLNKRTQECLNRAERAERPNSALSFRWDELLGQLQPNPNAESGDEMHTPPASALALDNLAETVAGDPSIVPSSLYSSSHPREWDISHTDDDDEDFGTRLYDTTPSHSGSQAAFEFGSTRDRPGSSGLVSSLHDSLRRAQAASRASDSPSHSVTASGSASNVSSAVSSDTEHTTGTTALPKYNRDRQHRVRREAAKQQIKQQVETAARQREEDKEKRKQKPSVVSALRKKNKRENWSFASSSQGSSGPGTQGYASHG